MVHAILVKPFQDMVAAPDFLLQVLWEGLVSGVMYSLVAIGFVLIYKASGIFNFAQGSMVLFAALTFVTLREADWGFVPALSSPPRLSSWWRAPSPSNASCYARSSTSPIWFCSWQRSESRCS